MMHALLPPFESSARVRPTGTASTPSRAKATSSGSAFSRGHTACAGSSTKRPSTAQVSTALRTIKSFLCTATWIGLWNALATAFHSRMLAYSALNRALLIGTTLSLVLLATSMVVALPARAQDGYDGFGKLGNALFGNRTRDEAAYSRGAMEAAELELALADAHLARTEARIADVERVARIELEGYWLRFGLPADEAHSVAATFYLREEQIAINERAKREGMRTTADAAMGAYRRYEYLLANQLLIAAARAPDPAASAPATEPPPPPEK